MNPPAPTCHREHHNATVEISATSPPLNRIATSISSKP
jgi:hypothetical protein